jgi:hypothetical protein
MRQDCNYQLGRKGVKVKRKKRNKKSIYQLSCQSFCVESTALFQVYGHIAAVCRREIPRCAGRACVQGRHGLEHYVVSVDKVVCVNCRCAIVGVPMLLGIRSVQSEGDRLRWLESV